MVCLASIFSNIFQAPIKSGSEIIEQAKLFATNDLDKVYKISLKNKSGEYIFERKENDLSSPWHMVSPRNISANSLYIRRLFDALSTIKVKKIFPEEKLNTSNFSIDKPNSTIGLIDQNGKIITIVFGLMNTIDNSTYLKISERSGIYHVEAPNVSLENASISDLIESQIISINHELITTFNIFQGNKKSGKPLLTIHKKNEHWYDSAENLLPQEKIDEYLQELSNLKSSFIIDAPTDSQNKQINSHIKNPEYSLVIEDNKANIFEYSISGMVKEISDLDLKNEEYFIMTTSGLATSYLVKKEFYELFNRKYDNLKTAVHEKVEKN